MAVTVAATSDLKKIKFEKYPCRIGTDILVGGTMSRFYVIFGVIIAAFAVWALYDGMVYRFYKVYTKKLERGVRIAHISDLHSIFHGKNQSRLMKKLDAQKPDAVMLTGDIFDYKKNPDGAVSFLKQVCKYPCFYVTGNHEHRAGDAKEKTKLIRALGITALDGESVRFEMNGGSITVSGISDIVRRKYDDAEYDFFGAMKSAFSDIDTSEFNILLVHNNSFADEYKKYPFDLVLSGHAHGGQFRIPFIMNGFFVRKQGFFPRYAGGMYEHGKLVHIVSRGISRNPVWCPRIFNPTELVIIDILNEREKR